MTTPRMVTGLEDDPTFACCPDSSRWSRVGRVGLCLARGFPIVFVFVLLVVSIYFFFVRLCSTILRESKFDHLIYGAIPRVTQGALYICAYWILMVLVVYSYARAAFSDPLSPSAFNIKVTVTAGEEAAAFQTEQYERLQSRDQVIYLPRSTARMCGICNAPKPPRSHHCSTCRRCFLRMDHHCVWLDSCVGFGNYKFFFCLLFWATFMCGFIFGATLEVLIQQLAYSQLEGVSVVWLIMTVLAFALGVSTIMLLSYHCYLIVKGMSTIEHIELTEEREDAKRKARIQRRLQQKQQLEPAHSSSNLLAVATQGTAVPDAVGAHEGAPTARGPPATASRHLAFVSYSEGVWRNICATLGPNPLLWVIPFNNPRGNGIRFRREEATVARMVAA